MEKLYSDRLKGNWATLLLATKDNGEIDFVRLSEEIDILISSCPNGIYSNGTAGEFYSQTDEEFLKVSQLLAEKCNKANVDFQIGVSHMSPQISLNRLSHVKSFLPSAVQVILPDWFPVTIEEAIIFLKRMEEEADGIPLVLYNPPHAKKVLHPSDWAVLKHSVPSLIGVKVFDYNGDLKWYKEMNCNKSGLSVFVPGHNLATGIKMGADGAYSNVACLNPFAAQRWYNMMETNMDDALELEKRIKIFMDKCITPFIVKNHFPNHACDRFMALVGGWADVGDKLRWPYRSIPLEYVVKVREEASKIIPEFLKL